MAKYYWWCGGVVVLLLLIVGYSKIGFYTFPPMDVAPQGKTLIVWRQGKEPFFNSPSAMCELIGSSKFSSTCLFGAVINSPVDRMIASISYQEWAHNASVDLGE